MKQYGVYIIKNLINDKVYIGSSAYCIKNRLTVHKRYLKQNKHENFHLQAAYNKYGKNAFSFEIIEFCNKEECTSREQFWMDYYKAYIREFGYNIQEKANSNLNYKHSEESKEKMRQARLGKKLPKEQVLKSILARTGQKRTQKTKDLQNIKKYKKLLQYSLDGEFIKEWNSLQEAELFFNIKGAIGNCVRKGFNYTSCGFRWKYK